MKRIVSLVLALSMVLSMFATAFAGTTLTDVEGTEYESAVSALVELGLVKGRGNNKYEPEAVVTRAEMAKLLVIASGLEDAAELNVGATKFSDVAADHWATGFINVASEYGFINGYPEGTFAPDAEVKYSEAVTMVIRALGYASVVESKGTWPTNYIQQARELKVLDGVKYASYGNGATRGNVALLVWNMLRTYMWDIKGENESNGLDYGKVGITMIDKYFEDYTYATVLVGSVDITDKGEVMVSLNDTAAQLEVKDTLEHEKYEYFGNDFYTFVTGTEVDVLVNEEEETLLTIVPTGEDKLVDGTKADLEDEDYTNVPSGDVDYVYAIVNDSDKVTSSSTIVIESNTYVEEVEVKSTYIKVNGTRLRNSENTDDGLFEKEIVIRDDERIAMEDIEAGDVITKASVNGEIFYVIGSSEEEGKLTKYVVENSIGTITVDGEEYTLDDNAKYVIDPEDEDENAKTFANATSDFEDMKNEEITIICDALLGKVVRIEFDGDIGDDDESTTGRFFAISEAISKEGLGNYVIGLEDENGSDSYVFADDCATGKTWFNDDVNNVGRYVFAKLNDDGEIEEITEVVYVSGDTYVYDETERQYGEKAEEKYIVEYIASATFDEDDKVIKTVTGFANGLDVTDDVVVVTIVTDDNKKKNDTSDDKYSITFAEGLEAIKDLDGEKAVVIYDYDATFAEAKYVVLFDELANKSDIKVDIVATLKNGLKAFAQNKLGDWELKLEGETVVLESGDVDYNEYKVVAYETEDIEKNDLDEMIYVAGLTSGELSLSGDASHGYVEEASASRIKVNGNTITFTNKSTKEQYENCVFVLVTVVESDDFLTNGTYDADSVEIVDYDDLSFEKADRISGEYTDDVIFIIRGMEERP